MVINLRNNGKRLKFLASLLLFCLVAVMINGAYFLPMIVGWLIHEMGHVVMGRVVDVKLKPEMGLLGLGLKESRKPCGRSETLLATGGVIANLLWAVIAYIMNWEFYYEASMVLALVNLLPVLPLDGGKILRGILCRHLPESKVTANLAYWGQVMAMVFAIAVIWFGLRPLLLLLPVTVYLLAAADVRSNEYHLAKQAMVDYLCGKNKNSDNRKITC